VGPTAGHHLSHGPWAGAGAIRPRRNTWRPTSGFTRNPSRVRAMQTLSDYEQGVRRAYRLGYAED
jgi:hypothetical protein